MQRRKVGCRRWARARTTWTLHICAVVVVWSWVFGMNANAVRAQFRDVTPRADREDEPAYPLSPRPMEPVLDDTPATARDRSAQTAVNADTFTLPSPSTSHPNQPQVGQDGPFEDAEGVAQLKARAAEEQRKEYEALLRRQQEQLEKEIEETLIDDTEIRALPFRRITAGKSTEEDVLEAWGEPFKETTQRRQRLLKYRLEPFRQVDVTIARDMVKTILIHLDGLMSPEQIEKELRMTKIRPATVHDDYGRPIGLVYPERGVLLSYDFSDTDALIAKIQLEPIGIESFLLRASNHDGQFYESNLADLQRALDLDGENARAHWIRARQFALAGRYHDALGSSAKATNFDPENLQYRMTRIEMMAVNGNREMALRETKMILEQADARPELRAATISLLGDLIAAGEGGGHKAAMEQQLKAIEIAAKLVNDPDQRTRRSAKNTLIKAHMAIARNISLGRFQKQKEVVPKWLGRARALIDDFVDQERGDRGLYLDLYRQVLATAADIHNDEDPSFVLQELQLEASKLIDTAEDPLYKNSIEWKLGACLAEAVRLQRQRGDEQTAVAIADRALELLKISAKRRQSTPEQTYLIGRLHFHVGSLHAVHRKDHDEALTWYRRAEPLLAGERPVASLADPATHGEMFVSMGVAYWQAGDRQKAIDITEFGTDYLQRAVVDGLIPADVLSIPYSNLASMHKQNGNEQEARAFAELAEEVEKQEKVL